jgi:hypothetical protein
VLAAIGSQFHEVRSDLPPAVLIRVWQARLSKTALGMRKNEFLFSDFARATSRPSGTGTLNHIGTSLGYDGTSGIYTRQVQWQAPAPVCSIRAMLEALGPPPLQVFFATRFF